MEAILFIGIQGSGKTTLYRNRFFETHVRLNLDMLKTRNRLTILSDACIKAKQRYVIDNTNVGKDERAGHIERAKVGGFKVIGYYFEPQVQRALIWNQLRSGKAVIPVKGVLGTLKRLEPPVLDEGFDELYRVVINADGDYLLDPWPGWPK